MYLCVHVCLFGCVDLSVPALAEFVCTFDLVIFVLNCSSQCMVHCKYETLHLGRVTRQPPTHPWFDLLMDQKRLVV